MEIEYANLIQFDLSEPVIKKAFQLTCAAHSGQTDKAGRSYIEHPITVANSMKTNEEIVVALLHDIVEDSDVTIEKLERLGFPYEIVQAVKAITKIQGENYEDYLIRVKHNKLARLVKIADMKHNSDLSRLPVVMPKDEQRRDKYLRAIKDLSEFTCEKCGHLYPVEKMGEKTTRVGEVFCSSCINQYEIEWDIYEDWLVDDR